MTTKKLGRCKRSLDDGRRSWQRAQSQIGAGVAQYYRPTEQESKCYDHGIPGNKKVGSGGKRVC